MIIRKIIRYSKLIRRESYSFIKNTEKDLFINKEAVNRNVKYYVKYFLTLLIKKSLYFLNVFKSLKYRLKNKNKKIYLKNNIQRKIENFLYNDEKVSYKLRAIFVALSRNLKIKKDDLQLMIILCDLLIEKKLFIEALYFSNRIILLDPNNQYGYIKSIENMLSANPEKVQKKTYILLGKYYDQFSNTSEFLETAIKVFSHRGQSKKGFYFLLNLINRFPKNEKLISCKLLIENKIELDKQNPELNIKSKGSQRNIDWKIYHYEIESFLNKNQYKEAVLNLESFLSNIHPLKIKFSDYKDLNDKAIKLSKVALLLKLNPIQSIYHLYLYAKKSDKINPYLDELIIKKGKVNSSFVWKACKLCGDSKDLKILFNALKESNQIPLKFCRSYANAAQRAEEFDQAKEIYFRLIFNGIENIKIKMLANRFKSPSKSIGDYGTQALIDTTDLLNNNNIPHFAAAGTCLGIVREGRPIKHDQDIDIGIMNSDWDPDKLREIISNSEKFTTSIPHPKNKKIGAVHYSGTSIDFFRFYEESGKIWHNGVFVRWGNTPFALETRNVDGTNIKIPSGEKYLIENYGNWRKPDELFDAFLNGPNKEVIWPEYYSSHILRAINLSIRRGQFEKSISIIREAIKGEFLNSSEKDKLHIIFCKINKLNSSYQNL